MSDLVIWEDPPEGRRTRGAVPHKEITAELRAKPGEWARIPELGAAGYVDAINTGRVRAYQPAGSYEAIQRRGQIYVRYLGGPPA